MKRSHISLQLLDLFLLILLLSGCNTIIPITNVLPSTPETTTAITPTPEPLLSTPTDPVVTPTACVYTWFFANPPEECPGQPPTYSLTVAQHFEQGLMLWREHPDVYGSQIYVFFADNKWPYWNPTNDRWRSGMPESYPDIIPPPGYYQPIRGFGLVWHEAYFGEAGSARDRLGWATDQEFSLGELALQCHTSDSRLYGCYVEGPDNIVYVVDSDNNWFIWEGPTPVP
ncbi:MAG: hypothetical protein GY832_36435 [Chloroflexi bacterium]|nr:hypothetical protein [Chloroflexota bacterium]